MIVVDTNVILHLWTATNESASALALLESDPEWSAPLLWRSEMRNALVMLMRHRSLSLEAAKEITESAEALLAGRELLVDSSRVLELAVASGCTAYDCEFVALAEALDVELVTTDGKVLRAFPDIARPLHQT